jgi:hypothetical protein
MKLCEDCKWSHISYNLFPDNCKCKHPKSNPPNVVDGRKILDDADTCVRQRGAVWPLELLGIACGRRAAWFEPKST